MTNDDGSVETRRRAPRARRDGLLTRRVLDELVVYDLERHRAHALNPPSALLWESCDGATGVAALTARLVAAGYPLDERAVAWSLDRLARAHLLADAPPPPAMATRREVVRRLGLAAALLPAVATIVAPRPAEAQSPCRPDGAFCTSSLQCCSGCCHANTLRCKGGVGNCL